MWCLGACEGSQGLVSARAMGGTHSLWRRQANDWWHHLSLWSGRKTWAGSGFVLRKLWNSKCECVRFFRTFMPAIVKGKGHCKCHRLEALLLK